MSIFQHETLNCPACKAPVDFEVSYSLFADRRPDLRSEVIEGTFQQEVCPACGETFRLDPTMTYLDVARKQWILVEPLENLARWKELEQTANDNFQEAYGPKSPAATQKLGKGLQVRAAFGWMALREKLIASDYDLDDATLELTKIILLQTAGEAPLADDVDLRLMDVEGDELIFAWIKGPTEEPVAEIRAPRELYEDIERDTEGFKGLRAQLTAGPFVDMGRLLAAGDGK
jgi:hypothetical protein